MLRKLNLMALCGLLVASLGGAATTAHAQSKEQNALEFYKIADAGTDCEMFVVVFTDFAGTTAAKLAKIKYKSCLQGQVSGGTSTTNNSNSNSSNNSNSNNSNNSNSNSNSNNSNSNNSNSNNSNSNNSNNYCRGYLDHGDCITSKRELTRYLQEGLKSLGCSVGRADGVWGQRTTKAIKAANRQIGTNFRRSHNPERYAQMIDDINDTSYNVCDCPYGERLNSNGRCVRKAVTGGGNNSGSGNSSGGNCQWYAISTCSGSYSSAQSGANKYGGWVINTSDPAYPNFRSGYFCSVEGPYNRALAKSYVAGYKNAGASTAYIKKPCK